MELRQLAKDLVRVPEIRHLFGAEEVAENHDVVECHRHATAGQRMSHVERIAQDGQSGGLVRRRGEVGVGHGAQAAFVQGG